MKPACLLFCASILLTLRLFAQGDGFGPHNINGHGCASCHTPSAGIQEVPENDLETPSLWAREADFASTDPAFTDSGYSFFHTVICLTCHDGAIASLGVTGHVSAVAGIPDPELGRSDDGHPVHVPYLPNTGCPDQTQDCSPGHWPSVVDVSGRLAWSPDNFSNRFNEIYIRAVRFFPSNDRGGQAMVECATCHNPHSHDRVWNKYGKDAITRPSRNFVRGWYDPDDKRNDTVSRFCQSCHYTMSPESVGIKG